MKNSQIRKRPATVLSGRRVFKSKSLFNNTLLVFLSTQTGSRSNGKETPAIPSMFKAQTSHHDSMNVLEDKTFNNLNPLTYLASISNEDVLCFYEAMKAHGSTQFKEEIAKEINNFNEENFFKLALLSENTKTKL